MGSSTITARLVALLPRVVGLVGFGRGVVVVARLLLIVVGIIVVVIIVGVVVARVLRIGLRVLLHKGLRLGASRC